MPMQQLFWKPIFQVHWCYIREFHVFKSSSSSRCRTCVKHVFLHFIPRVIFSLHAVTFNMFSTLISELKMKFLIVCFELNRLRTFSGGPAGSLCGNIPTHTFIIFQDLQRYSKVTVPCKLRASAQSHVQSPYKQSGGFLGKAKGLGAWNTALVDCSL